MRIKIFIWLLMVSLLITGCNFKGDIHFDDDIVPDYTGMVEEKIIAHAMGLIDFGEEYLNCLECLEFHYAQGTKIFEIDLAFSSDNKIIATHRFENVGKQYSFKKRISYEDYLNTKMGKKGYSGVTSEIMIDLMKNKKDIFFLIDTKESDKILLIETLVNDFISSGNEKLLQRIIPYIYNINDYVLIEETYSFRDYMFTAYQNYLSFIAEDSKTQIYVFLKNHPKVSSVAVNFELKGITGYNNEYIRRIKELGKKIYLFTIKQEKQYKDVFKTMYAVMLQMM